MTEMLLARMVDDDGNPVSELHARTGDRLVMEEGVAWLEHPTAILTDIGKQEMLEGKVMRSEWFTYRRGPPVRCCGECGKPYRQSETTPSASEHGPGIPAVMAVHGTQHQSKADLGRTAEELLHEVKRLLQNRPMWLSAYTRPFTDHGSALTEELP